MPATADNPIAPNETDLPNVTVTIGPVTIDDDMPAMQSTGGDQDVPADWICNSRFERDGHTYMMGVTSPGGFQGNSVAFVRLTAATELWICDWTACRLHSQPELPDPTSVDSDWVLLDDCLEMRNLEVIQNGATPIYRVSGTFIYGKKSPASRTNRDAFFPLPPWLKDVFNRSLPDSSFNQSLKAAVGNIKDQANAGLGNIKG